MSGIISTILFAVVLIAVGLYIINIPTTPVYLSFAIGITCIGGGILAGIMLIKR